jgi:hypothetical protein
MDVGALVSPPKNRLVKRFVVMATQLYAVYEIAGSVLAALA